ncbi:hypothetical protein B9T16_30330, partial [Arthrospira sp. PCC 8006]
AGLLSALGIGLAPLRDTRQASLENTLDDSGLDAANSRLEALESAAREALQAQGANTIHIRNIVNIRVDGSDTVLPVELGSLDEI